MLRLYNTVLLPLRGATTVWAAWSARTGPRRREWSERLARTVPSAPPGGAWIHGASVGEARLVGLLAAALRADRPGMPVSVSAYTRTGRSQLPEPPRVDAAFFVPADFPGVPGRILDAVRPRALVLVETEMWPNLLHEALRRGVAVALVNGRLSVERMGRYRTLRRLWRLDRFAGIGAQSEDDAERFRELGARPGSVHVTGNIKFDLPAPEVHVESLRARFGLDGSRPVLAAGSTADGEDGPVLEAFASVRRDRPSAFLVLAPRHPERVPDVARLLADHGLRVHRLSAEDDRSAGGADVLLLDRVGALSQLYALASVAFVGGSLVPVGGHNVLEPAAVGVPVVFGPHTHHVSAPAEALLEAGGAVRVRDAGGLAHTWRRLLDDAPAREDLARRAADVVARNRGALERSLRLIVGALADRREAS